MRIAPSSPATTPPLAARPAPSLPRARRGTQTWRAIRRGWQLYVILLLPVLYLLVFSY
jgi:hypothetical protein